MSECEHRNYTICNEEHTWIDAYCDDCNARLIFDLTEIERTEDQ